MKLWSLFVQGAHEIVEFVCAVQSAAWDSTEQGITLTF